MKFLKTVLSVAVFAIMATSCEKNDDILGGNYMEQDYTGSFSVLSKKGSDGKLVSVISEGTTYKFRWRADNTADIYIYNAKFSTFMPNGISIAFEGLKWSYAVGNTDVKILDVKDVVPTWVKMREQNMNDVSNYLVDEMKISIFERRLGNFTPEYIPVINLSMKVGDVEVTAIQKQRVYFGTTAVVGESIFYPTPKPVYLVSLNPTTGLATIDIYKAKFADKMPAMDMKFENIPFQVSNTGYTLASEEIIPSIKNVPYPQYAITNLNGNATLATGMDLRFNCIGFDVQAKLGFPILVE